MPFCDNTLQTDQINKQTQHATMQGERAEIRNQPFTNLLNVFVPYPSSPISRMSYWPSRERHNRRKKGRRTSATWAWGLKYTREGAVADLSLSRCWVVYSFISSFLLSLTTQSTLDKFVYLHTHAHPWQWVATATSNTRREPKAGWARCTMICRENSVVLYNINPYEHRENACSADWSAST